MNEVSDAKYVSKEELEEMFKQDSEYIFHFYVETEIEI